MRKSVQRECLRIARCKNTPDIHPEWGRGFHHFSFIIYDNKILEWGMNRLGPPLIKHGYSKIQKIHSEPDAFNKAKGLLRGDPFEIINIRLNKRDQLRMSKPCQKCYRFLKRMNCSFIYFSTDLGFAKLID